METISMHCKSISQIQPGAYSRLSYFTGRRYIGVVLIQVWCDPIRNE